MIEARGGLETPRLLLERSLEILADEPLTRAALLRELAMRGLPPLTPGAANLFSPWAVQHGHVVGLADGRLRPADPPSAVDEEEALATLVQRYLGGYGPASVDDAAYWSGLPAGAIQRGVAAAGPLEQAGDLLALPGTFEREPPPAPDPKLLPAFDTLMLGWRSRALLVPAGEGARVSPGGGVIEPVVLARGIVAGTWRIAGSGRARRLSTTWFGRPLRPPVLDAEAADVARFLGVELLP